MNRTIRAALLTTALAIAPLAQAQTYTNSPGMGDPGYRSSGWGIEMRTGPNTTTDNFASNDLDGGLGFDFHGTYQVSHVFGLYAGVSLNVFDADNDFTRRDNAVTDIGYVAGVTVGSNFGASRVGWRLHGGANYGEIKLYEDDTDNNIGSTGHELGWEAGAAITIALPNKWVLSPGITYHARPATLRFQGIDRNADLHYVRVGIGFGRQF